MTLTPAALEIARFILSLPEDKAQEFIKNLDPDLQPQLDRILEKYAEKYLEEDYDE